VKKVQDAVTDSSMLCTQFVNSVPENVCQRSPEFKPKFGQSLDSLSALRPRFALASFQQFVYPFQHGNASIAFPEKDYASDWHLINLPWSLYI